MDKSKLRVVLEYEFRRGSTAAQAVRNITVVFGEDAPNERTVRRWFAKFESGDFDLQNESRGRPECKLNNDELKAVVEADPTQSTRELAAKFGVCKVTISSHLKQIGKSRKLDRWVPHDLSDRQKMSLGGKAPKGKNMNYKILKKERKEKKESEARKAAEMKALLRVNSTKKKIK